MAEITAFKGGIAVMKADGTVVTVADADGNIDAPVTTSNLSTTGTTTLGDAGDATQINGTVAVGVNDTGYDVTFFGATAGQKFFFDESADTVFLTATVDIDGTVTVGVDDTGYDVKFFGDTASNSFLWDTSADKVVQTFTSASTSAVEPYTLTSTLSGTGVTGGRFKHALTINGAAGSFTNAIKGDVTYGASGKTTGLGSAVLAEMTLSAGTSDGTYSPLEVELNVPSGASLGTQTSMAYLGVQGADVATFDASGNLMSVNGLTAGGTNVFRTGLTAATVNAATTAALRIKVDGVDYFIPLATATA